MLGIFDSGLGGLTVVKEITKRLPGADIVYFGDTARMPYGIKSKALVTRYAIENARFLLSRGATAIVVACNTASAHAVDALRKEFDVPIFEVVTPAVRKAAAVSAGRIGVIGTAGTVASGAYERRIGVLRPDAKVIARACPLFVPLVEEGWHSGPVPRAVAQRYLSPLRLRRIDTLVLGCTHYPFLRGVIADIVRPARLIDPAREAAEEIVHYFANNSGISPGKRRRRDFYVSDLTPRFSLLASRWLGHPVKLRKTITGQ